MIVIELINYKEEIGDYKSQINNMILKIIAAVTKKVYARVKTYA